MRKFLPIIVLFLAVAAHAQLGNTITIAFPGVPTGSCSTIMYAINTSNGNFYDCLSGSWNQIASAGSGTVTSFSSGNLSPLFTTSVATPTTTPALSFSLSNAAAGSVFGNNTGSSAAPAFQTNIALTQGTITTSTPLLSHTVTWNAGGVAFTNWLSNITCTAAATASIAAGLGTAGTQWQFKYNGANCGTPQFITPAGVLANPAVAIGEATSGFYQFGTHQVGFSSNGFLVANFNSSDGLDLNNGSFIGWCTGSGTGTCTSGALVLGIPLGTLNAATTILRIGGGAANPTTAKVAAAGYIAEGTTFTSSGGCSEGTLVGGATAGKFTTSGSTSCTTTITMGNSATAPNGWSCTAIDLTTLGDVTNPHQTATAATTATIATGTIVANDVIQFSCIGY